MHALPSHCHQDKDRDLRIFLLKGDNDTHGIRLGSSAPGRIGMDLRQYLFYVTAHRYVAGPLQFRIVAVLPFFLITVSLISAIIFLPGLWKWSMSLFLFVHTTMCAGDFALLNFYLSRRGRKIYTWDDADLKIAYFYQEI
jgi:hypothetical protein